MQKWPLASLVIRIYFDENKQVDWHVPSPSTISFQDVIDIISQASSEQIVVTAFEYEDEDGDRITVKTSQELNAMIAFHTSCNKSEGGMFLSDDHPMDVADHSCLVIYPKHTKPSRRRNVHGLKVAIAPTASSILLSDKPTNQQLVNGKYKPDEKQMTKHGVPAHVPNTQASYLISDSPCHSRDAFSGAAKQSSSFNNGIKMLKDSLSFQLGQFNNDALIFLETLGNGNSGVVRKAVHKESRITTAVKAITLDLTWEEQRRILQELEILKKCNGSPFIIAFYGAYFDENRVLLCTEFMDGGSLDQYGAIPDPVLRNVASAISHGLQHLWLLRIMHRDVKPSNILVNTDGYIKLCDFGVSTQLVDSIARTYVGTNAYMAPERVIGHDYTIFSDVWSFGLSLCELAIGEFPYTQIAGSKGVVPMEVMQCIVNDAPPHLPAGHFSPDLCDFVNCCLQKEAENRSLPEQLCMHSVVISCKQTDYSGNLALVSSWIKSKLNEKLKRRS